MRVKQFITWMLLSVYLLAVAGPAMCSLSCKCVVMQSRTNHSSHICSCCCGHDNHDAGCDRGVSVAKANSPEQVKAPCCRNHHSTEINLYIGNSSENERHNRVFVIELPAAFVSENSDILAVAFPCERLARGAIPDLLQAHARSAGLRAPPVSA